MEEKFMLREVLNNNNIEQLSNRILKTWNKFNKKAFITEIERELNNLSFGDRSKLICEKLKQYLPDSYEKALNILINSLQKELVGNEMPKNEDFIIMPQCLFVSKYGLEHFDISINALYEMTKRFTAEGDIRYFILKYPEKTEYILLKWAEDKNFHVRRLASEGSRPRLPLGIRLPNYQKNPSPVIKILEKLKKDPELYVRRSVANNLNDISKDNPKIVTDLLKIWSKDKSEEMRWLIKHSLRTLLKEGNKEALALLGYFSIEEDIIVENLVLDKNKVKIGEDFNFSFQIKSNTSKTKNLMIDYIIHHKKANGKNTPKVFKLSKKILNPSDKLYISKNHSFKLISTRKYYSGDHYLEIKINGKNYFKEKFLLLEK